MSTETPNGAAGSPADHMRAAVAQLATRHAPEPGVFVSDLLVGELVLLDEVGYEPVDLVSGAGAASWNPQVASAPGGSDAWAAAITGALGTARAAIEREVVTRSAEGVVAVQLSLARRPGNVLTCSLLGTAVRRQQRPGGAGPEVRPGTAGAGAPGVPRPGDHAEGRGRAHPGQRSGHVPAGRRPFGTTLSARDFHLLVRAGYEPAGIAAGAAVVAFPARSVGQGLGLSRDNLELQEQTAALYQAREIAMARMEAEARAQGADGVVDVSFGEQPFNSMLVHAVEVLAIGTAIRRTAGGHRSLEPRLQLALDDAAPDVFRRG